MNTIEIPFNKFVGIKKTDNEDQFLLELPASENLENHLGTVHASAQFALAEACSGEFLLKIFEKKANNIIPVVRKVETKFKNPANGKLLASASLVGNKEEIIEKLERKKRVIIPVDIKIMDKDNKITMTAKIDWFIQKI
jgi:acyl-coenzyme A thioesterase PaaI-like protein